MQINVYVPLLGAPTSLVVRKHTHTLHETPARLPHPGCSLCKANVGGMEVPQKYATVGRWSAPKMQISKEPCAMICKLLPQYN